MARAAIDVVGTIDPYRSPSETLCVAEVLRRSNLPAVVHSAPIAYSDERLIDDGLIEALTVCPDDRTDDPQYIDQLAIRRDTLSRFKGQRLLCVVVRLPGVIYTLEINPETQTVVHWEWQAS